MRPAADRRRLDYVGRPKSRSDPFRRLAAAAMIRACEDLKLLDVRRKRCRGWASRERIDVEARGIVAWMSDECCWARVLDDMDADAGWRFLATLPAEWRNRDGPENPRGGGARAGVLPRAAPARAAAPLCSR